MSDLAIVRPSPPVAGGADIVLPTLIGDAGDQAARRFIEFFTANIRNPNTRAAYARVVADFFGWCERHGVGPCPPSSRCTSRPTWKRSSAATRLLRSSSTWRRSACCSTG